MLDSHLSSPWSQSQSVTYMQIFLNKSSINFTPFKTWWETTTLEIKTDFRLFHNRTYTETENNRKEKTHQENWNCKQTMWKQEVTVSGNGCCFVRKVSPPSVFKHLLFFQISAFHVIESPIQIVHLSAAQESNKWVQITRKVLHS